MAYLQKKIIITGQNDVEGNIYVTDYKEEDADEALNQNDKVDINGDDNNIEEQVANIRKIFLTNDQAPETVSAPTPEEIAIKNLEATQIPWRVKKNYEDRNVLDYITWIKKIRNKSTNYNKNALDNIVVEYDKLINILKTGSSISEYELNSFFNLTENLKKLSKRGGKTKKLRVFRKKTLRNQRNSKKRLGSRKNLR